MSSKMKTFSAIGAAAAFALQMTGCCMTCEVCDEDPDIEVLLDSGEDLHGHAEAEDWEAPKHFRCPHTDNSSVDEDEHEEANGDDMARYSCHFDDDNQRWLVSFWESGELESIHYQTVEESHEYDVEPDCEHQDDGEPEERRVCEQALPGEAGCLVDLRVE